MAAPVWQLSVDLSTKSAVFTSGLADAARGARSSFQDIKQGAAEMGRDVGGSMSEARHGVTLLGEEFGVHLPRALTTFIAGLGPVSAAMEAAFPFLAIIVGATLLLQHLEKIREEGSKLTESQANFGTTVNNVLNGLNDKLLQAGIRADELNHDHLGALNKQLELIDHASMKELVQAFDVVSKAADATFAQLKTSWYQWGAGSAGAKNALEQFKTSYDSLLAQGKDKEANDLLAGTRESAERVLALQKQAHDNQFQSGVKGQHVDSGKYQQAANELKREGIGFTQKEVEAQETLVGALQAQANVQSKVNELKAAEKSNAGQTAQKGVDADSDKMVRAQAQQERQALEEAERARDEAYRKAVAAIQENERQKIAATDEGSRARLAAIDAAIKDEESKGLQETGYYKELLTSRVNTARQMADEQKAVTQKLADEELQLEISKGTRTAQAAMELARHKLAIHQIGAGEEEQQEIEAQKNLLNAELTALDNRIAALDRSDEKQLAKIREFENRKKELIQQNANEIAKLEQAAETRRVSIVTEAYNRMGQAAASTAAQSIMQGRNMAQAFERMGGQMLQSAITNLMQLETVQGRKRFGDARTAAADAFQSAGNPILGAVEAAAAFTAVMAFEKGGLVPGVAHFDSVPAMLTPGEAVLPKELTERLSHAAKFGGESKSSGEQHIHIHSSPTIHALDAEGMSRVLDKHSDTLARHFNNHLRKQNR